MPAITAKSRVTRSAKSNSIDQAGTEAIVADLRDKTFQVWQVKKGNKHRTPGPPFTTSTLQQEASRFLGFTSKRTMSVAQQLYEGIDLPGMGAMALVTYIRTDSVRISTEATDEARRFILDQYGKHYLPAAARSFKNRNSSQDAHEAIRPAHFELVPDTIRDQLSFDQYRLYKLIWDKFIAIQMAAASIDTVVADIAAGSHVFRAQGETVVFPGFLAQYGVQLVDQEADVDKEASDAENAKEKLPELNEGESLLLDRLLPEQKFTQPPSRYTEATLIKAMEEQGIGRPSTYAPTISTIQDRLYVEKDKKFLLPTELGKTVTVLLEEQFNNIVDVAFTAKMEEKLDTVESGQQDWIDLLDQFYPPFHEQVVAAEGIERVKIADVLTGDKCPECHEGDLVVKEGRFGKFVACSRYPECKYTKNVEIAARGKCPLCGSGLLARTSKKFKGSQFYTCDKLGNNPECPFISWDLPIDGKVCETCGTYMVWKRFKGRSYPRAATRNARPTKKAKEAKDAKDTLKRQSDGNTGGKRVGRE